MRVSGLLLLPIALLAAMACGDDGNSVTVHPRPPLGGVRYINAVADGGPVDIRMVDQVPWSANTVTTASGYGLPFRAATIHWSTEAKARHIRVFPTDSNIAVTSTILHDTTITVEANRIITLMLVGSRAAGNMHFVTIDDTPPGLTGDQIGVRLVNASSADQTPAAADGYFVPTPTTALPATPEQANVAPRSASSYMVRDTGAFAIRVTGAGAPGTIWSAAAPAGAPESDGVAAAAGFRGSGSALSAYVFPRACPAVTPPLTVANCPALTAGFNAATVTAFQTPGVVFFVDLIPDPPTTGG